MIARIVIVLLLGIGIAGAQPSATVGSVRGVLVDRGGPATGAVVIATSSALPGEQTAITDARGAYFLSGLPPGVYRLTIYYLDAQLVRDNVLVQLGKQAVVDMAVDSAATAKGERIMIAGTAPLIDQGSTKIGITLTDDYTRNVPTGRLFGDVAGAAAGAQKDRYGISLAGTTSPETSYIVDGLLVTDPSFATLATQLPNEFISETEVITGGHGAEYGRATGGVVNVITKQGSNELHGSFFGHYTPSSLIADAATIQREGSAIDSRKELTRAYDLGMELGGPVVRDALWFHVGFSPQVTREATTRIIASQVDVNQDGIPDIDPASGFTIHDEVATQTIPTRATTYYFTAKLTGALGESHRGALFTFGNPSTANVINRASLLAPPETLITRVDAGSYNIGGTWTSKLDDGATEIAASAGLQRTYDLPNPVDERATITYGYDRSLYDFADIESADLDACRDLTTQAQEDGDPYRKIRNCPVTNYAEQGAGVVFQRRDQRLMATLSLTHRLRVVGYHVLKLGFDAERATDASRMRFPGGFSMRRNPRADGQPGAWQRVELFQLVRNLTAEELGNPGALALAPHEELCRGDRALCAVANPVDFGVSDTNLGTYVQDSWLITPTLTLNAGVRWDHQMGYVSDDYAGTVDANGEIIASRVLTLDNVAPRAGIVHDPSGEGRSKLFAHVGRFYETLPLTATSLFTNGFTALTRIPRSVGNPRCDADRSTPDLVATVLSCELAQPRALFEPIGFVAPGLRGQYTNELVAGAELEVVPDLDLGATYQHRTVPVVVDDVSLDGGNTLFIANPGENFDAAAADLYARADELDESNEDARLLAQSYRDRASWLENVKHFEKPIRNYDALQLTATVKPTPRSLLLASYTYSLTRGNYPGLFNPDTGQLAPNVNAIYDLPSLLANRYGALAMDRPHNLHIDGFYRFDLPGAHSLTTGAAVRVQSGLAYTALGSHAQYGAGESYLLSAGALGRRPATAQLDVHFAFARRLAKDSALEAFIDVFNLFDAQTEISVDQRYTTDAANPVVGGAFADLEHVKAIDPTTGIETNRVVKRNPNFTNTTARQRPRSIQLGLRWLF